jgi:hypothetical protein
MSPAETRADLLLAAKAQNQRIIYEWQSVQNQPRY